MVDEVEELVDRYGLHDIAFLDDTFMLHRPRAGEISREIRERGIDVSFVTSSRVDMVRRSLLEDLRSAGMSTVYYGVESGCQRILNLMEKGITLKQAEDAVKAAKDVGVDVVTSFILGYPGEKPSEMDRTIDFSIKLDPDYSQYSIQPVIKYEKLGLSRETVMRKLVKAYIRFYSRPSYNEEAGEGLHQVLFKTILPPETRLHDRCFP